MRLFIWVFITLLNSNSLAQLSMEQNTHNLRIHLVLHSNRQFELSQRGRTARPLEFKKQLFLPLQMARLSFIDPTRVRFRLESPVHIAVQGEGHNEGKVELVFRSFIVNFLEQEIEHLIDFQAHSLFVFDQISEQRIIALAEDVDSGVDLDKNIRHFSHALRLPQLHTYKGLRIYVPIEDIGSPDGTYGRTMVIGALKSQLPWFVQPPPTESLERPLMSVYRTFDQNDPIIRSYLRGLFLMDQRRNELERLGWLKSLLQRTDSDIHPSSIQEVNIIPLFSPSSLSLRQCREIF